MDAASRNRVASAPRRVRTAPSDSSTSTYACSTAENSRSWLARIARSAASDSSSPDSRRAASSSRRWNSKSSVRRARSRSAAISVLPLPAERLPLGVVVSIQRDLREDAGVGVHEVAVPPGIQEGLAGMLSVNVDQRFGERPQRRGRGEPAADVGLALSVPQQVTAEDQELSRLDGDPLGVQSLARLSASAGGSKAASTTASSAPERSSSSLLRAPSTSWRASMRMDFPAPVSPVRMFSPGTKETVRRRSPPRS